MTDAQIKRYPYTDGDVTVIGPECFASADEEVICWRGVNYVKQAEPDPREWTPFDGTPEP